MVSFKVSRRNPFNWYFVNCGYVSVKSINSFYFIMKCYCWVIWSYIFYMTQLLMWNFSCIVFWYPIICISVSNRVISKTGYVFQTVIFREGHDLTENFKSQWCDFSAVALHTFYYNISHNHGHSNVTGSADSQDQSISLNESKLKENY
jgi:hypothetical protein